MSTPLRHRPNRNPFISLAFKIPAYDEHILHYFVLVHGSIRQLRKDQRLQARCTKPTHSYTLPGLMTVSVLNHQNHNPDIGPSRAENLSFPPFRQHLMLNVPRFTLARQDASCVVLLSAVLTGGRKNQGETIGGSAIELTFGLISGH